MSMGDRVCIDTIMDMKQGEGMLIGNFSNAFFCFIRKPSKAPMSSRGRSGPTQAPFMRIF